MWSAQRAAACTAAVAALTMVPIAAAPSMDLHALWNYDDPAQSEARFREALPAASGDLRLELLTQIARTHSLRRQFAQAHAVLDEVEPQLATAGPAPRLRYLLERGRTFRSAGEPAQARPLFEQAWTLGQQVGNEDLALDAAHMMALVERGEAAIAWNLRALSMARAARDPHARRWQAPLLNNLGFELRGLGRHDEALRHFRDAVTAYETRGDPKSVHIAHWQVARTLRDLARHAEALDLLRRLERDPTGADDGYVQEELAENLDALGRSTEAKPHFRRAFELLSRHSSLARDDPARLARLEQKAR